MSRRESRIEPESTRLLKELVTALLSVYRSDSKPTDAQLESVDEWLDESRIFLELHGILESEQ